MSALLIIAALTAQAGPATNTGGPAVSEKTKRKEGGETYLDFEGSAGYSSNPTNSAINHEASAFGRIALHGVHSRVSDRSSSLLSVYGENVSYTNHQGSQQSLSLYGRHDTSVTEHVRLFVDANANYQENGQLGTRVLVLPEIPPVIPGTVTPPILVPPSGDFLSVTGHEFSFGANGGGSFALGPKDGLSVSSGFRRVVFHNGPVRSDYNTVPVSLSYDRQLSPRASVGTRLSAEQTNYSGPLNYRLITPQLTGHVQLAQHLNLSGAIGVSFARVDNGITIRHTTGLAAQVSLCGLGEGSSFCTHAAANEDTATTAGPSRSIGGGVEYARQLDANQSIAFSLGYTHYSTPVSVFTATSFSSSNYASVAGSYSRRIGNRLFGGINLSGQKVTHNGPDPKADLTASLFIRYRFGDVL